MNCINVIVFDTSKRHRACVSVSTALWWQHLAARQGGGNPESCCRFTDLPLYNCPNWSVLQGEQMTSHNGRGGCLGWEWQRAHHSCVSKVLELNQTRGDSSTKYKEPVRFKVYTRVSDRRVLQLWWGKDCTMNVWAAAIQARSKSLNTTEEGREVWKDCWYNKEVSTDSEDLHLSWEAQCLLADAHMVQF